MQAQAASEGRFSAKNGAASRSPALAFLAAKRGMTALAVAPDGTRVANAGRDGVLRVHDLTTGALITGFKVLAWRGEVQACKLRDMKSRRGEMVAAGD